MTNVTQLVRAERRGKNRYSTPGLEGICAERRIQVVDISLSGLGLASRWSVAPSQRLQILLRSPVGDFTVTGRVVWCRFEGTFRNARGEAAPRYHAGLRFDPLHPRDAQYLLDLLDRLATRGEAEQKAESSPPASVSPEPVAG